MGKGCGERLNSLCGRSKLWENVSVKHGWYADIIAEFENEADAFQCEKEVIVFFGRRDLGTGPLVNLTEGGEGTSSPKSEAHKKKIGDSHRGKKRLPFSAEWKERLGDAHRGKPKSKEHNEKNSLAHLGIPHSNERKTNISLAQKARLKLKRENLL